MLMIVQGWRSAVHGTDTDLGHKDDGGNQVKYEAALEHIELSNFPPFEDHTLLQIVSGNTCYVPP